MGNIFGRFEGSDASAGSVLTGSHCDAIPLAGQAPIIDDFQPQTIHALRV